jgi:transcriptional regulator with XRE-family HTH domain
MEWTAENIRQLRAAAQITQAQLATWLGVTIKQVKHLENRRRNPSGPVERLLDIYTKERDPVAFPSVQVLGSGQKARPKPRVAVEVSGAPADDALVWDS